MSPLIMFLVEVPLKSPFVCLGFNFLTLHVWLVLVKAGCERSYWQPIRNGMTILNATLSNE